MLTRRDESRGFTLVGVLVALGIFAIVGGVTAAFMVQLDHARYRMEAIGTRDAINMRMRRMTTYATLQYSANRPVDPGNIRLGRCLIAGAGNCTDTNSTRPVPFILMYPDGSGNPANVAGSDVNPTRYCHNGSLYNPGANPCRFEWEARTVFIAGCPGNAASCSTASFVRIGYKLTNVYLKGQNLLPQTNNGSVQSASYTTIQIAKPGVGASSKCNPYSVVIQVDAAGAPTCQCLPGTTQTGFVGGQPNCSIPLLACPTGQVASGYDVNMQPICRPAHVCTAIPIVGAACNGFIQSMNLGGCTATNGGGKGKGKKASGSSLACNQDTLVCCTSN